MEFGSRMILKHGCLCPAVGEGGGAKGTISEFPGFTLYSWPFPTKKDPLAQPLTSKSQNQALGCDGIFQEFGDNRGVCRVETVSYASLSNSKALQQVALATANWERVLGCFPAVSDLGHI